MKTIGKNILIISITLGLNFFIVTDSYGQNVTFEGCVDARGIPVASIPNNMMPDVAKAVLGPMGQPIILYNIQVLSWFRPQARLFWYVHECAHHALAHLIGRAFPPAAERQADCWAISVLYRRGILSKADVDIVASDLAKIGPGDWSHLPGSRRAIDLYKCL